MKLMLGVRGNGKTTRLIEEVVAWLETHEGKVDFVGCNRQQADYLKERMRELGLLDRCNFVVSGQEYKLRGRSGELLAVDNMHLLPKSNLRFLHYESQFHQDFYGTWDIS